MTILLFLCIILFGGCVNKTHPKKNIKNISKIVISDYDSHIVTCPPGLSDIKDGANLPLYIIFDSCRISQITHELSYLKETNKQKTHVKCTLSLYKNDTIERILYIGDNILCDINGRCFIATTTLWSLINQSKEGHSDNYFPTNSRSDNSIILFCESIKNNIPKTLDIPYGSVSFIISCKISKNGRCLDAKVSEKDPLTLARIPNELKSFIERFCYDYKWDVNYERKENEWIFIPVSIRRESKDR